MDKSSLLEDIFKSIEKIEEDYKAIKKKELVNELEIELFVSKTRYLYEKSIALKYISKFVNQNAEGENIKTNIISTPVIEEEIEEEVEEKSLKPEQNNPINKADDLNNTISVKEEQKEEQDEVIENNLMDEEKINIESESITLAVSDNIIPNTEIEISDEDDADAGEEKGNKLETDKNQEDVYQKIEQIADLNSKLRQENKTSLYERFSQLDKQGDLLNKFQQTPIQDLKKSVGLNERYLFSKTLFNNEMSALIDALDKLNKMESFDDALKFISTEYDEKYNWKEHGEEQLLFINTIKRKFV